jgi:hypothetical protein
MNKRGGTNRWIGIRPPESWISYSRKLNPNPRRGFFASGHREIELGREPPFLGAVSHALPPEVQELAVKNYGLWRDDPPLSSIPTVEGKL